MENVLLVDDEVDICLLLSGILQREGFRTSYALSVREAKERLTSETFEAVFVDLNLPDGVGYQLIPMIREKAETTKIIVVSAYDSERNKALDEGAHFFIAKPFSRRMVMDALRQLALLDN